MDAALDQAGLRQRLQGQRECAWGDAKERPQFCKTTFACERDDNRRAEQRPDRIPGRLVDQDVHANS